MSTHACHVCFTPHPEEDFQRCDLCKEWVHSGPEFYCAVVQFELLAGQAVLGNVGNLDQFTLSFPRWPEPDTGLDIYVVCADCLLSEM